MNNENQYTYRVKRVANVSVIGCGKVKKCVNVLIIKSDLELKYVVSEPTYFPTLVFFITKFNVVLFCSY